MSDFETTVRVWLRGVIDGATLDQLDHMRSAGGAGVRLGNTAGLASLLGQSGAIASALSPMLVDCFPTRVVAFDKSPTANWGVPWHQDRTIAVEEKVDMEGYTNWSNKAGLHHCEPPQMILDHMLFVRLHLDDDSMESGPMQIALGSHRCGLVRSEDAQTRASAHEVETCIGKRGDILVLKMLTLHRSSDATQATSRRVLRVDYVNAPLPQPLRWHRLDA
ncbi:phytanoyl-CoA dioxygenase family protein [uncultured Sulfitobacter sp.]|uniref:phytanoyl-CoA dioxygenase family protein n=1 Tax=uncultured Sulfitobacter sp. TaxID=191468 RepID=UPI00261D237C|nr:phytanoyl-CoA dioxygenase family protein [uncultured Sulfitobacter sp.]